jgi:hypothetical protein
MDKLARQLRDDAECIEVTISAQLENRLQASLAAVEPERPEPVKPAASPARFWWASSLTGVAAAVALVVVVNWQAPVVEQGANNPVAPSLMPPKIDWKARTAVLTNPLEQEIEDLQSDMKKAEQAVKQDIQRLF